MAYYVVYNKETTVYLTDKSYSTEGAAKAQKTRACKKKGLNPSDYEVSELVHFRSNVEKTRVVKNLMSGKDVEESVNLPYSCSVASENYWCS